MKHASGATLDAIEELLQGIRKVGGLTEKKRGVFYHKSKAFLHFHEDVAGIFADLKVDGDFERFRVSTKAERKSFLRRVEQELG